MTMINGFKLAARRADDNSVTDQVVDRCPGCASAVRPGSPWCTLCFTDLRPASQAPELAVSELSELAMSGAQPAAQLLDGHDRGGDVSSFDFSAATLAADSASDDSPDNSVAGSSAASWPCMRCGERVAIDLSACSACGAGFMDAGPRPATSGLGRLGSGPIDKKTQFMIMVGGAGLLCAVILILMVIFGVLF